MPTLDILGASRLRYAIYHARRNVYIFQALNKQKCYVAAFNLGEKGPLSDP
jgi:hypothetical protein